MIISFILFRSHLKKSTIIEEIISENPVSFIGFCYDLFNFIGFCLDTLKGYVTYGGL